MYRALGTAFLFIFLAGCQIPPERLAVSPFPEDGQPVPYADLVTRARLQATAASEAFYLDRWGDLEDAAAALEQTSRFLVKATEVPAKNKETLPVKAASLGKEAGELKAAAKGKEVKRSNEVLQRINFQVRELRPEKD